ncbi:hypothetical protein K466DRAFT_408177 [Polyporus arcularius HHB13444]|uniref:Uncharacterized protein n=1 Tax=Polyporus arcularius HHB13444 TaxID=1314778 RepID=A0A5C3NSV4_9APHY|nr:hypothetical protein K466DRAFT_408177 [Polyporus arcularius HHB13444]
MPPCGPGRESLCSLTRIRHAHSQPGLAPSFGAYKPRFGRSSRASLGRPLSVSLSISPMRPQTSPHAPSTSNGPRRMRTRAGRRRNHVRFHRRAALSSPRCDCLRRIAAASGGMCDGQPGQPIADDVLRRLASRTYPPQYTALSCPMSASDSTAGPTPAPPNSSSPCRRSFQGRLAPRVESQTGLDARASPIAAVTVLGLHRYVCQTLLRLCSSRERAEVAVHGRRAKGRTATFAHPHLGALSTDPTVSGRVAPRRAATAGHGLREYAFPESA